MCVTRNVGLKAEHGIGPSCLSAFSLDGCQRSRYCLVPPIFSFCPPFLSSSTASPKLTTKIHIIPCPSWVDTSSSISLNDPRIAASLEMFTIENIKDGEIVHQMSLLIKGFSDNCVIAHTNILVSVSAESERETGGGRKQEWPMSRGCFKALVILNPGKNDIIISNLSVGLTTVGSRMSRLAKGQTARADDKLTSYRSLSIICLSRRHLHFISPYLSPMIRLRRSTFRRVKREVSQIMGPWGLPSKSCAWRQLCVRRC